MDSGNDQSNRYRVILLPWLFHGHISPFLELAKRLTTHDFHVYLCSTPIHLQHMKNNLPHKYSRSIEYVELNHPSSLGLAPNHGPPPNLTRAQREAYVHEPSPEFPVILQNIRPQLLIYDLNQWWAAEAASSLNIPSVQFLVVSAVALSLHLHFFKKRPPQQYPFPDMIIEQNNNITRVKEDVFDPVMESMTRSSGIILIKSIRELDGKYIDYMSQILGKTVLPIGPLTQELSQKDDHEHIDIFRWLDEKKESSVVYLNFGSQYHLSDNEIEDIAYGLELSNVSFLWVLRLGSETSLEQKLPHGFLERIGERGMVVEKWVPQTKILSHSSMGGFVSHCGWGSFTESISYGLPIIATPMQYEQFYNAKLVEEIGVGMVVGRDGDGRLQREEMAAVVRKVVVEDDGGSMIRKKVLELSEIMSKEGDEVFDKVVKENLVNLCQPKR